MDEIWKDLVGFEEYYKVSNLGRILRKPRAIKHNMAETITIKQKILSPFIAQTGYLTIEFQFDNKRKSKLVHRLVAEAFIPNPENKPYINHIDGDKSNAKASNLEWCNNSENQVHAYKNNLQPCRKGENQSNSKLKSSDIPKILKMIEDGEKGTDIAKLFNVSKHVISKIKNGKAWTHVSIVNTSNE